MSENKARSLRGELYHAFTKELVQQRTKAAQIYSKYNNEALLAPRRRQVELWRQLVGDERPLPPRNPAATEDEDETLFEDDPMVLPPFRADNGVNVRVGKGTFINHGCVIVDTCLVSIGERVLLAPNVCLYSGSHPLDPGLRNGTRGPEDGKEIHIEDDCWIGGSVVILPGITIGKGSTIGAGSVVTKNIPPYSVAVGNPARVIKQAPLNSIGEEERKRIFDIANEA